MPNFAPRNDQRIRVEQAIARGETLDQICDRLRVDPSTVDAVLAEMDAACNEDNADDLGEPCPIRSRPSNLKPCGTHAAYNRHKQRGETPCPACLAAEKEYTSSRCKRKSPQTDLAPHGTHAAYVRHESRHEAACVPCRDAERAYRAEAKRQQRARRNAA